MATASPRKSKPTSVASPVATASVPVYQELSLNDVIEATKAGNIVYTSPAFHNPLIASGQVEINPDMIDEHGNIATRAILKENKMTDTATVETKPVFEIEDNVEIPEKVRKTSGTRAGRTAVYPFEKLEVGQSFFVPNKEGTNKKGQPFSPAVKAMASTVAGANARYSEVIEGETRTMNRGKNKGAVVPATKQTRLFKLFEASKTLQDGSTVPGAYVKRME